MKILQKVILRGYAFDRDIECIQLQIQNLPFSNRKQFKAIEKLIDKQDEMYDLLEMIENGKAE